MILIDGVKYELMKPENEEMLEEMVREHSKDIWGENSVYFDKKRLKNSLRHNINTRRICSYIR